MKWANYYILREDTGTSVSLEYNVPKGQEYVPFLYRMHNTLISKGWEYIGYKDDIGGISYYYKQKGKFLKIGIINELYDIQVFFTNPDEWGSHFDIKKANDDKHLFIHYFNSND
ncbi:MAG: hypothetical protein HQL24_02535 [Candidatus Omnitrophica bacterium]|nr:hypothetical protein [Candidatus Omnitrophota bacterium]